jgi:hypothetical protein
VRYGRGQVSGQMVRGRSAGTPAPRDQGATHVGPTWPSAIPGRFELDDGLGPTPADHIPVRRRTSLEGVRPYTKGSAVTSPVASASSYVGTLAFTPGQGMPCVRAPVYVRCLLSMLRSGSSVSRMCAAPERTRRQRGCVRGGGAGENRRGSEDRSCGRSSSRSARRRSPACRLVIAGWEGVAVLLYLMTRGTSCLAVSHGPRYLMTFGIS